MRYTGFPTPRRIAVPRCWPLVAAIAMLPAGPAWAETLTLPQSVARAAATQPDVLQAGVDEALADAQLDTTRAGLRPTVGLETSVLGTSTRSGDLDFVANNAPWETRAQVVGRWALDNGQLAARLRQAEAERMAARWAAAGARQAVARRAVDAYFEVLKAQGARAILAVALHDAEVQLNASRVRFNAGTVARLEPSQAEQAVAAQQAAIAGAEADLAAARARFQMLTGVGDDFLLAMPAGLPAPDVAVAVARPDVEAARALLEARHHEQAAAGLARRPQLALNSAVGWDTAGLPGPQQLGGSLGVDFGWPFYQGGLLDAQARVAELGARKAELEVRRVQQVAALEVSDARAALAKATAQVKALERARGLADKTLSMAKFGYGEGSTSLLEVFLARRTALDARLAAEAVRLEAHAAQARLRLAMGGTL
ncbi:MAG: hypothetical protein JWM80_2272 [Cyanobacteria bacterium RYN_339]|nr:hypothetical protein [Cyanobacteria bacterium RYN_339]